MNSATTDTQMTLSGVEAGVEYFVVVRAGCLTEEASGAADVLVFDKVGATESFVPLLPPTLVSATPVPTGVRLTWDEVLSVLPPPTPRNL